MISKYSHKELNWIDLESPSEEEIIHTLEEYPIPSYIKEEIMLGPKEYKTNQDSEFIFISLDLSNISANKNKTIFVVCDDFVLTIHDAPIKAFDIFSKEMELDIAREEKSKINNNKLLFTYLLKNLHASSQNLLIENESEIKKHKKQIIKKNKKIKLLTILSIILLVIIILISLYALRNI